jgi:hypothetical protein
MLPFLSFEMDEQFIFIYLSLSLSLSLSLEMGVHVILFFPSQPSFPMGEVFFKTISLLQSLSFLNVWK